MPKILVTRKHGAGWSTWESNREVRKFMLTYAPIIEHIKAGNSFTDDDSRHTYEPNAEISNLHPVLRSFVEECRRRFNHVPFFGGCDGLSVQTVSGPFRIAEHDGRETVESVDPDVIDLGE